MQLIPETTGMGHKCTLTVNPERITDLQWQATDRTLPDNPTEIAGEASKTSENHFYTAIRTLLQGDSIENI